MRTSPGQDARNCHQLVTRKDGTRQHFTIDEFKDKFNGQELLIYAKSAATATRIAQTPYEKLTDVERSQRAHYFAKGDAQATASPNRANDYCLIKLLPNGTAEITNGLTGRPVNAHFEDLTAEQIAEQRRELTPTEIGIARGELDGRDPNVLNNLRSELKARAEVTVSPTPQAVALEPSR